MPGALPVPNEKAIRSRSLWRVWPPTARSRRHSMFYRKHYFYPGHGQELPDHAGARGVLHARVARPRSRAAVRTSAPTARLARPWPRAWPVRARAPWASRPTSQACGRGHAFWDGAKMRHVRRGDGDGARQHRLGRACVHARGALGLRHRRACRARAAR